MIEKKGSTFSIVVHITIIHIQGECFSENSSQQITLKYQ